MCCIERDSPFFNPLGAWANAAPNSVGEVSNTQMQQIAEWQAVAAAQGQQWNNLLLGARAVAKPVDHKRMTRRKWWLVRKAIPLPWVRRNG